MIGRVIKIFSDFYYVKTEKGLIEAKVKTVLKKQKEEVYTGDYVELEQVNLESMQAFISKVLPRTSLITRPKAANITQVIIVSALKEPELNFEQLDRYIAHCEYNKIKPILCFNKEDIEDFDDLKKLAVNIYEPLNYEIVFTSALKRTGIEELKPILKNNTSILCGSSGAGKSSLINAILNNSELRTQSVSEKTKRGVHTTRHCELITIENDTYIVDTPGFSHLKFDFIMPVDVQNLFVEFNGGNIPCKYKNCLHTGEEGCNRTENIKTMDNSRYTSYKKFIEEAKEYEKRISKTSIKKELNIKFNQNKIMTKISQKKRTASRKTNKQNINNEEI